MPENWDQISTNNLLNYTAPETGVIARYERIMVHKATVQMETLGTRMQGLGTAVYKMHQGLSEKADVAFTKYDAAAEAQTKQQAALARQQTAITRLTWVIAVSTAAYTIITALSVIAAFQANHIQARLLKLQEHPVIQPHG